MKKNEKCKVPWGGGIFLTHTVVFLCFCACFGVLLFSNLSIYVIIPSIFLGTNVSAFVPFCPAQLMSCHTLYLLCLCLLWQINMYVCMYHLIIEHTMSMISCSL